MAKMSVQDRGTKVAAVVESMERDMELLCLTGVEDKLQDGVRPTLELLRNAGIKVLDSDEEEEPLRTRVPQGTPQSPTTLRFVFVARDFCQEKNGNFA